MTVGVKRIVLQTQWSHYSCKIKKKLLQSVKPDDQPEHPQFAGYILKYREDKILDRILVSDDTSGYRNGAVTDPQRGDQDVWSSTFSCWACFPRARRKIFCGLLISSLIRIRNLILICSNYFWYKWRNCKLLLSSTSIIPTAQQFSSKEISKSFLPRTLGWKRQFGPHSHLILPLWTYISGVT
jgi:hypothetical protein